VHVYALTSTQIAGETLDMFLTQEAAEAELREILKDELVAEFAAVSSARHRGRL
jgi:hypothetical protein